MKDYPDLTFEDGKWPAGTDLTLDAADSTPESVSYHWTGSTMNVFLNARESSVEILPNIGQSNLNLELTTADGAWTYDVPINLTIEDFFYVDIQTSLAGESVSPGTPFTFLLTSFTFDGAELESFIFDPGQREVGNGQFIDVAGEFQCKEAKTVQCLIDDAIYDGVPRLTGACGCPTNMNGAGTIYVGEKEGTKDDNAYSRKFDRDEFEYSFIMEYPSKTACGSDRVCQVELEITDVNGRTAEKIIELNLPAVQSCGAIYPNSLNGNDSTQFVGQINDGEQSCECKTGYSPEFDALSVALSGESRFCEEDIIETEPTPPIIPGIPTPPTNPTTPTPPTNSFNDLIPSTSDKNESSSALTTLLILMLVALAAIFGFELYEKKKKGSYFNPFGKSKPKSKLATPTSKSPIEKFISDAKNAGEDPTTIKQNLKNSGWPEDEINKYI